MNDNVIQAAGIFGVRNLIAKTERFLRNRGDHNRYDVYCTFENDGDRVELWLRDRRDNSRVGPLDSEIFAVD